MLKRLLIGVILLTAAFAIQPAEKTQACSGYPYFGVEDLPTMELLVKATIIDTDNEHNAILRVEEYYKGEGDRFITVMRYSPALISGALVRGYDTGCLYAGRGHQWIKGGQGYFGLMSNGDGTYTDENYGTAHFYPIDGVITYDEGTTDGYAAEFDDPLTITEKEFVTRMLEIGGRETPLIPVDKPVDYPLMRFLTLTTENGTRYQVNPNRSVMKLDEDAPLAISPDGAHVAFAVDEETIAFQYIWTDYLYDNEYYTEEEYADKLVPGKAVRFANDSSFAAVWDENLLTIYMFSNHGHENFGNQFHLMDIAQMELTAGDTLPAVTWSADSSTLIWEDQTGIWHWNIYEAAAPQQVLSPGEIDPETALLDISTTGRYVRIGTAENWTLIDMQTSETYANAIPSPDEHFLLFFNNGGQFEPACKPPLRDHCTVNVQQETLDDTFLFQGNLIGTVACHEEACRVAAQSWHPAIGDSHYSGGRFLNEVIPNLRQVAYDPQYRQAALLIGDYDIHFDFEAHYYVYDEEYAEYREYFDVLMLEDQLDSPIVSLEWGQPIFYSEYFYTTAEYLPE